MGFVIGVAIALNGRRGGAAGSAVDGGLAGDDIVAVESVMVVGVATGVCVTVADGASGCSGALVGIGVALDAMGVAVDAAGEVVGGVGELVGIGDDGGVLLTTIVRVAIIVGVSSTGVSAGASPGLPLVDDNGAISKISAIPMTMVTTIERSAR
jgi:hypothetical protein